MALISGGRPKATLPMLTLPVGPENLARLDLVNELWFLLRDHLRDEAQRELKRHLIEPQGTDKGDVSSAAGWSRCPASGLPKRRSLL